MICNKCNKERPDDIPFCPDCDLEKVDTDNGVEYKFSMRIETPDNFEQILKFVYRNTAYYEKAFLNAYHGKKEFNLSALIFGPAFVGYRKIQSQFLFKYFFEIVIYAVAFLLCIYNDFPLISNIVLVYPIFFWVKFARNANTLYLQHLAGYTHKITALGFFNANQYEDEYFGTSINKAVDFAVKTFLFHLGLIIFALFFL